jgi:hypothetical protein
MRKNNMVEDLKISGVIFRYKLISAPEIMNHKRGILNLGNVIPKVESKISRVFNNRKMIEEFLEEMADQGWEYRNQILYEGLPNNGCLVFRREQSKVESIEDKTQKSLAAYASEYESIAGANAIWRGKKTKGFKDFLRQKGYDLTNELGQEIQTENF